MLKGEKSLLMKKYQIVEITENSNHAGKKAPADVAAIAKKLGYKPQKIVMNTTKKGVVAKAKRQVGYWKSWNDCYSHIEEGSVVLIQNPFHNPQLSRKRILKNLKEKKKVTFISLIHDVEELRNMTYDDYYKAEFSLMLELSDVFIVHNDVMKEFFLRKGVPESKIVVLGIFDYLHSYKDKKVSYSKNVLIAGNLDTNKSQYIGLLHKIKNVNFDLYGVNYNEAMKKYSNIVYKGSFPVDEIPVRLDTGFGLVWDGTSLDGCKGASGEYLKYNNPHKLSLYLSAGLPVVIWSKAAEAKLVKEYDLGICIDNLNELPKYLEEINEERYNELLRNVKSMSQKLIGGYFTTNALNNAEKAISHS